MPRIVSARRGWPRAAGRRCDDDAAGADHHALHGALGLLVEHGDDVAFGAAFGRLAAHREHDARHLVDQRHRLVALDQFRLHQVGGAQRPAGLQAVAGGKPDRLRRRSVTTSRPISARGRRSICDVAHRLSTSPRSDGLRQHDDLDRRAGAAGQPQTCRVPAPVGNFERGVEAAAARVVDRRVRRAARPWPRARHRARATSRSKLTTMSLPAPSAILRRQRLREASSMSFGRNRAARARHPTSLMPAVSSPISAWRAHRLDHGVGGHRAG